MAGLVDLPRCGRPARFTAAQVAEVKAIACSVPDHDKDLPLARWSVPQIASQAVGEGVVDRVSRRSVARWLARDLIRPWQTRSWISPRDPDFAERAGPVLDLYQRTWDGQRLGGQEYVLSADEKPGIQALRRRAPARPLGPARPRRVELDYTRGGTPAYLAAMDTGSGRVMGTTDPTTGIVPFERLVEHVMGQEPYTSADRVFWIVDNGSSHRGSTAA